jgi:uncharacterized protein (DUF952 family)
VGLRGRPEGHRRLTRKLASLLNVRADLEHPAIEAHIRHDHVAARNADFPHLYDIKLPRGAVAAAWPVPFDAATQTFTFPAGELE